MEGWRTRELHRDTRAMGSHSILESVGEGADTSFDDVLDIVVPYATYGSSNTVACGTPRLLAASELCPPFRYNVINYRLSGAQQTVSGPTNLVLSVFTLRVVGQIRGGRGP